MEKLLLIYNPNSGKKNITQLLDKIVDIFMKSGKVVTLYRIGESQVDFKELVTTGGFDGVVVCGGDGSVNTMAKLLIDCGIDIPIGVIPNGTCNDFSRSLGMPSDPIRCARLIAQGNTSDIDIGMINGGELVFVNELAGGVMVSVSFSTDQNLKKILGPLAYYVTGIGELGNIKPFALSIETEKERYDTEALVFCILNGTDMSGFSGVIKEAQMQDGVMDILVFKNTNPLEITDTLLRFVSGSEFKENTVLRIKTKKCRISCNADVKTTVDGEKGPAFPLELEMKHKALKFFC